MKYSTEYRSSSRVYAGCTQEYVLNLLPLYRLIFPHETVKTHKPHLTLLFMRTDLAVATCLFIWLHSEGFPVCLSVALPAAADIFKDSRQIPSYFKYFDQFCAYFFQRVRPALSLPSVVGAVWTTCCNFNEFHGCTVHQWYQTLYCPTNAHKLQNP